MLDPKRLRENLSEVASQLHHRGFILDVDKFSSLEEQRRLLQTKTQELQNKRNTSSKAIGQAKAQGLDIEPLRQEVGALGEALKFAEDELSVIQNALHDFCSRIPNLPHASVPIGKSEEDNVVIRSWGTPTNLDFQAKDHTELGEQLNEMDFELGSKIAGARFVVLKNQLARLHRALVQFMLDTHTQEHGYQEVYVPYLANQASLYGTGQFPKLVEDSFEIQHDNQAFYLIPTSEVSVTNFVRDTIVQNEILPLKFVCHSPCFRSEAGSYGKDTRGMIRQHQFDKVELIQITRPEDSYEAHESLTSHAETILKKLELPFRTITLCTGDMGFSAAKTYDLEVWLPSQQRYREISSCSNCEDFQARRMQARYKNPETKKTELVHTLNGSGLAIGRTLVAIMENFQDAQGNIHLPKALWPYMGNTKVIRLHD